MRIVALRLLGLGDFLTVVPVLRALAKHAPEADLVVIAPARFEPFATAIGWRLVDAADINRSPPQSIAGADLLVNLHGRGPQSHAFAHAARPRRMLAFSHSSFPDDDAPPWAADEHERDRWCRLLRSYGIAADPADLGLPPMQAALPGWVGGSIVLHIGASTPSRCWPADKFATVASALASDGQRVVVTGGPQERDAALIVARNGRTSPRRVVAGQTSLAQLAEIVRGAAVVVSGDTGASHLASAYATPSVTLCGPVDPALWGPPGTADNRHRVLWRGLSGDPHGAVPDPGLRSISPDEVLSEVRSLCRGWSAARAAL